ncbi:MAG: diguanylate cyclase domain-containing protein [Janthinobacterium lividum]|uniref:GGDEF domain-containing protein n=1 Tax=Pseudomonas sp. MWU16-30317 TaxID=2878095 RepID=UPI001CFB66DA|nr:diguanylate cyclase [Pseudomonas sp. MWU16-30317]
MPFSVPDHSTADDPRLLAQVEQAIASGVRRLRFDSELEHRYEADTHQQRLQFLTTIGIIGGLVYNVFMLSDWLTLHDMFAYVALGRVCLITPMIIGLLVLLQRLKSRWALETVAATGTVLSSLMPLVVMIYSDSPYRMHFQLGMVLIMVYCTMIQQMPLRYAAWAMLCMVVIQLVTTYLAHFADFIIWQSNALLFVSTAALLVMATYFMERGKRFSYLFSLRGRLLQKQLMSLARTDSLTQLFNRRYQGEVLMDVWEQAQAAPTPVATILLDIDHFKAYNDSYGHLQGDACLKRLSEAVQQTAEDAGALAFRFGGEEILLLLVDADASQARVLAEALQAAVAALQMPHPALGEGARVTISLGIAAATAPQISADALIGSADSALYAAKHAGRDCLRFARPEAVGG